MTAIQQRQDLTRRASYPPCATRVAALFLLSSSVPSVLAAAAVKVNSHDGLAYVLIPKGTYLMGCSPGDRQCFDWEVRPHVAAIRNSFWLGQTEVTQSAFERVTGANPSLYRGVDRPVERVGWIDARSYCEAVKMRLPTEAEC